MQETATISASESKSMAMRPAGSYQFKLTGQWYYKGEPVEGSQFLRFYMPVKREGIIPDITTLETTPSEVRPGDNYVKITAFVENTGEKDAKGVEVKLNLPEGIGPSYANANRVWVGGLAAGEKREATFYVDVDQEADAKTYTLDYQISYMDLDDNSYSKVRSLPFLIKPRPYIEVVESGGQARAGSTGKLSITLKNTGQESAESVDVRLLKQSAQPFEFDVRSLYLGELEPGEEGTVSFDVNVARGADIREHDFKVLVRSKGDSDEGDDNIYTYSRRAKFTVTGEPQNIFLWIGSAALVVIVLGYLVSRSGKKKLKNKVLL